MAPTGQSCTQLITRFKKSTTAWIWVASQQNWKQNLKQRLVEFWKAARQHL